MSEQLPVSVVVPARNAADTIGETLASLQAQTRISWEAIIVDDDSTDETAAIVAASAARDPRLRVVVGAGRGVGAARNLAISECTHRLLLFLDADDLIDPTLVDRLARPLEADPALIGSTCGWARLTPTGETVAVVEPPPAGDLFAAFSRGCVFPIHSCVVWTDDVRAVGGFDESLQTCEDWDLWLRLARTGRAFASVEGTLALYRMRERSASLDGRRMLLDGLEVLRRARRPDPRMPGPCKHPDGVTDQTLSDDVLNHLCWTAGLALGSGGTAAPLAELVGPCPSTVLSAIDVAGCIFTSALLPRCLAHRDWPDLLDEIDLPLEEFLLVLEEISAIPLLALRARRELDSHVLAQESRGTVRRRGTMLGIDVELTQPLEAIEVQRGVERVVLRARLDDEPIGEVMLAAFDRRLPVGAIADGLTQLTWPILGHLFGRTVYPTLRFRSDDEGLTVLREDTVIATGLPEVVATDAAALHDAVGWAIFLQELFAQPTWHPDQFYDRSGRVVGRVPVRGGERTIELADPLAPFAADGTTTDVEVALGGAPLGIVRVGSHHGIVSPESVLRAACTASGFELARLAVREGLLGRPLVVQAGLRARVAEAARSRRVPEPSSSEMILGRTRPFDIGGPQSRTVALPASAASELLMLARLANSPIAGTETPSHVRYDPGTLHLGASTRPSQRPSLKTRLHRRSVGSHPRRDIAQGAGRLELRILMYHSISDPRGGALDRYILAPERFEEQLRLLRAEGYRTLTFDQVGAFVRARKPLPGRALILTFDDAFEDFLIHAQPLLEAYAFEATLFVPTAHIGGTNAWDATRGEQAKLLTWRQLRRLVRRGTSVGSHSATHPFLTTISLDDVVREAASSRAAIIRELDVDPLVFSYPHGDNDAAVRSVIGGCGYAYAVTTEGRCATPTDDRLALPRLEVPSGLTLDGFARLLGLD